MIKNKKYFEKRLIIATSFDVEFSPSAFAINILQMPKVIELFLDKLYHLIFEAKGSYQDSEILREISILPELEEWSELLLPLDNIEYIIRLGEQLQERDKKSVDKPSTAIKNYFEDLTIELEKYNPVIAKRFKSFLLVKSVLEEKRELMDLLDNNLQNYLAEISNVEVIIKDLIDNL